jgi:4-aminobutyrate aminotransferase-like enzyme
VSDASDFERLATRVPGPRSTEHAAALRRYESRNVTHFSHDFPVFWESAHGSTVVDVDGNRYLDLTAAFGVANAGHANARVAAAVSDQAARLMHGLGDVHPTAVRARLLERLDGILPHTASKAFLATTGSETIEAAIKTAMLATGRTRFASYRNAYHGLSFGALALCGLEKFRDPFAPALGEAALLLDYPDASLDIDLKAAIDGARTRLAAAADIAGVFVEPIQGRGGCIVPPDGYLRALRALCDELGILMIADEIYTGFGRTGTWFAIDREGVVPDIICIGKAMGSGFPISAAVGRSDVMDAWPVSLGEALHTSTYLGNPMGCAAALATFDELERRQLPERAAALEPLVRRRLDALLSSAIVIDVRGRGLLWGVQLRDAATAERIVSGALASGIIVLQSGASGDVIAISPPLVIDERQLSHALDLLEAVIGAAE